MSGLSCGQSLLEQGRTKILAVVRLSGLCGDLHFSHVHDTAARIFEAATASRRQKCALRAPGVPAGESRALRPAPRATAGPAAPAGVQLGREGDKRGPGGAPRPPGRLNLEDMAALWCPRQGPVVRCRCGPALPSYAARRTASKGTVANFALPSQISPVRAPVWSVTVALPNGKVSSFSLWSVLGGASRLKCQLLASGIA